MRLVRLNCFGAFVVCNKVFGDFIEELGWLALNRHLHFSPFLAGGDKQFVARARYRNVKKPPLFFDVAAVFFHAPRVRNKPFFRACNKDDRKFQSL